MNWPTSSLDELTEQERRITYGVVKPGDEDPVNGILFVRGGDIFDGQIAVDKLRTITQDVSNQYRRTLLRGGELLISLVGNPGAVAMVPPKLAGANIARQAGLVALKEGINHKYVEWFLRSPAGQAAMGLYITGAVQKVINLADLKRVRVPIPPVDTQRRIASILSAYDDLIENNTRRIAILEEMARRIYEEWFVRFRFPGHEQVKMVESELGLIPEGWSRATLGEVAKVQWGDTSLTKASYVEQGYVAFSASGPDGFLPHFQRDGCGIVLSAIGAQCGKTWLARGQWGTIKNTISLWSLDEELISNEYLYLQCSGESYWPRRGAAQPFISLGDARNCPVLRPTREVMAIFSQVMRSKFQLISILERKNANLRATRDLLLPKLISGELDVSTLPEPEEAIAA